MKVASVFACFPLLAGVLVAQSTTNGRLPGEGGQGLTVKLLPPSPQTQEPLRYELSEPAYVAAFVVYPGAGVRLLSPTVDIAERVHAAGYNTDQLIGVSFDNDAYNVVLGPKMSGPAYLYVIASRHPLDVARYVHKPMTLASAVGEKESRSFYNDVAFDALLNNAIALGDDTSWDSDVYMLWPGDRSTAALADGRVPGGMPASMYTYVLCTDGTTRYVPINYPFIGCPGQRRIKPIGAATRQVQQSASAAVASPTQQTVAVAQSPTVLPNIIGPRLTDAERRAAIEQRAATQRMAYTTVANGDQQMAAPQPPTVSPTELQVIAVRPRRTEEGARRERDAIHGQFSPEQRERFSEQAKMRQQNGGIVGGAPQLAPNPRLAPNPGLSPAPGMGENHAHPEMPRPDRPHRDFDGDHQANRQQQEQHSAPRDMPRPPPRMNQASPAAAEPAPHPAPVADKATGAERPARIQQ